MMIQVLSLPLLYHRLRHAYFRLEENAGTIVGISIAGVAVIISVVFLTICLRKRNKLQCMQSNQQQAKRAKVFFNTTYDDLVVTNNRPEVNYANTILEKMTEETFVR